MKTVPKAKLLKNGASQTARLPADSHFEGAEVPISRDETTPNDRSSRGPEEQAWAEFLALRKPDLVPKYLMVDRPMNGLVIDEKPPRNLEDRMH